MIGSRNEPLIGSGSCVNSAFEHFYLKPKSYLLSFLDTLYFTSAPQPFFTAMCLSECTAHAAKGDVRGVFTQISIT